MNEEQQQQGPANGVWFEFSVSKEKDDKHQHILMRFNDAQLHIDFVDDGSQGSLDLGRLVTAVPMVVASVRREVMIRQETDGVDDELRALLGTEGDEV